MSRFAVAIAMTLTSVPALACPLSQSLAAHYGISFSGFKVAIPETRAPDTVNGDAFVRVMIPDDSHVSDGFRHTLVMNSRSKKVWILRTSGFAGVYQWFGPVDAIDPSLTKCRLEPNPALLKSK